MSVAVDVLAGVVLSCGLLAQQIRWLRVLQREHYLAGSLWRFVYRWWRQPWGGLNLVAIVATVVLIGVSDDVAAAFVSGVYGVTSPLGLSLRGRTGALSWTRRARTVAVLAITLSSALGVAGAFLARPWLVALATVWITPLSVGVSAWLLAPYEKRRADVFVRAAQQRLARVAPTVVAITGSYGKTSTKNHLNDLLRTHEAVVASPRSYNNRAGLSRAINENLVDGTRVFIAEMGTYGPGEIAALCSWCPPDVAVVTAIGPVHLERMKSLDVIEQAKFEITRRAPTVVLNVDDPRLASWVGRLRNEGKRVVTAGTTPDATVRLEDTGEQWRLSVDGVVVGTHARVAEIEPTNLACAVGAAWELGLAREQVLANFSNLRAVDSRLNIVSAASGVVVIDDTFNANPASAKRALVALRSLEVRGRRVVVTPGLVELGSEQKLENALFAGAVKEAGADLVVVATTNKKALHQGFGAGAHYFRTRDRAVAWVRSSLHEGDAVLYVNDLPDHYP